MTDTLSAQYFCDLIGVSTVETTTLKKSNSLEGEVEEFGQKNISTLKRNLMNVDEILRIPANKLLVNIRGNKPLLLDKMMYKEHFLSVQLKDSPISEYNPNWNKNTIEKPVVKSEKTEEKRSLIGDWNNF